MKNVLLISYLLITLMACKSNAPKEERTEPPTSVSGLADSLNGPMDTSIHVAPIIERKETSKPHITDHFCSPNFTLLAKPQPNREVFYVSGFDHQEFKCWEEIQKHALKICGEKVCTIYYVDKADIKVVNGATDLMDPAALKENGVGKFVYDGKYWSLNGSSIWKRQGNGWSYYTTNNQFGG